MPAQRQRHQVQPATARRGEISPQHHRRRQREQREIDVRARRSGCSRPATATPRAAAPRRSRPAARCKRVNKNGSAASNTPHAAGAMRAVTSLSPNARNTPAVNAIGSGPCSSGTCSKPPPLASFRESSEYRLSSSLNVRMPSCQNRSTAASTMIAAERDRRQDPRRVALGPRRLVVVDVTDSHDALPATGLPSRIGGRRGAGTSGRTRGCAARSLIRDADRATCRALRVVSG